ncbi:prepilin-type N-terminal cleavage/methylation domain-containing protein [Paucibacter sediminis]|uniref:Prepilin-type N-terminal cleavage/methylation domain-containing protein n=1 Tax=Paucibacter sediminis TaxID=3019553 RepID=A0AA95NJD3_9BURK|nr:prepilin-type N-terminal cleavage/methylation domain-containing protein [Paucibacter sp. S2-9]WIT10601.1 prepilin-type N-terminal cleavage/methylation domain-containing protein [Paucibacter sp. S2-9]
MMLTTTNTYRLRTMGRQRGFTLIEAMVALLIMAFSMLGLAGMQMVMSRNADLARQRSEATRLAQEKIEELRAFNSIEAGAGKAAWDSLASAPDEIATGSNVTFTRQVTMGGSNADAQRTIQVAVSWVDRAGETKSVTLNSYIAKTDPALSGALGFPLPGNGNIKRPKNRNLNIPIAATDLGEGKSAVPLGNFVIVFSNDSGYVVRRCGSMPSTAAEAESCENYPAYILAGYVSGSNSAVTGLNFSGLSGTTSHGAADCSFGNAENQNTPGAFIAGYKYYLCVMRVAATTDPWAGKVLLTGMASGSNYLVCRFQYAATNGLSDNQRNFQAYTNVRESLDQQNYYITTSGSCPTVSGLATTLHQRCISSNANRAIDCPASPDPAPAP